MQKAKEDEFVQCPYYRRDTQQAIHCEGVQDNCGLHLGFGKMGEWKAYKDTFCRKDWTGCMVAKMLNCRYAYDPKV